MSLKTKLSLLAPVALAGLPHLLYSSYTSYWGGQKFGPFASLLLVVHISCHQICLLLDMLVSQKVQLDLLIFYMTYFYLLLSICHMPGSRVPSANDI